MDANRFVKEGSDAESWRNYARSIRRSADALWECWAEAVPDAVVAMSNEAPDADAKFESAYGYVASAQMLYGLALETAFKASILANSPETVEIQITTDGRGEVTAAELKQLGVPMSKGHDLVALATKAGAFYRGAGAIYSADSDYAALQAILGHLTDMVVWMGRYPIPRRSGQGFQPPEGVPSVAFGHRMIDWIDPVLDFFLQSPDGEAMLEPDTGATL